MNTTVPTLLTPSDSGHLSDCARHWDTQDIPYLSLPCDCGYQLRVERRASRLDAGLGLCIGNSVNLNLVLQVISGCKIFVAGLDVFWFVKNLHAQEPFVFGVVK